MAKPKKKKLPSLNDVADAAASVLGSDAVHKGSNSDQGEPKMYISSGVPELDLVLDREGRGWPSGRIVEIYGAEATCKTGIAYALIAQAQAMGGVGVLVPAEGNFDAWLAEKYKVNLDELIVVESNTVEEVFSAFSKMMGAVKDAPLVVVVDSIAGLCTKTELEDEDFDMDRQGQVRAQLISKALRKIGAKIPATNTILFLVNQINEGESLYTGVKAKGKPPGGKRIAFYASIRLRLEIIGKYERSIQKKKSVAGFKLKITAEKNRMAKPFQEAEIRIDFEGGLLPKAAPKKKEEEVK